MDPVGRVHTNGPTDNKRYKTSSTENNGADSSDDLLQKESKLCVGRFFYEHGLDFNHVDSPSFHRMLSVYSQQKKCSIPTSEELKGWIFNDVMKETREHYNEIKKSWIDTGCSILLDGWKVLEGRELVNILVDCPRGTVYLCSYDITYCIGNADAMQSFFVKILALVGIENVVQIITYSNSAFMKEAGKQLMEKYRPIFWTVSSSYCIELMLEKLMQMDLISETLEKAKRITRFVYSNPIGLKYLRDKTNGSGLVDRSRIRLIRPFLTLENMVMAKEALKAILNSTAEGKRVAELVGDRSFWCGASTVLKGVIPLVRVIQWMNGDNKDHIGYIYETIDQAKETIKEEFKSKESDYSPFWKVIDYVWNECLYSPLHSAGYYLNPNIFYSSDVFIDPEIVTGLFCCVVRSSAVPRVQDRITIQMEQYRTAKGAMADGVGDDCRSDISPANWWLRYGGECPELQRLAVRILSQTCDGGSRFQLDRSLAETLLSKESKTDKKWMTDMVFLRYNMHLARFVPGKMNCIMSDKLDQIDDWIVDRVKNEVHHTGNVV